VSARTSQMTGTRRSAGPMTADHRRRGRATGQLSDRGALDRLVEAVRAGESRALVVCGVPGVGKTVLLDHLAGRASVRVAGWRGR
jgi:Cdc6-like AAA superfamily ATPase